MGACFSSLDGTRALAPRYDVQSTIGEGTQGLVYLCTDKETQELVAIKLIHRDTHSNSTVNMKREIQLQAQLHHVNIVELKHILLCNRQLGLVMEYLPGGDLHSYCSRFRITEPVARYYFRQILAAVSYCHHQRIVHRDLKLQNFVLDGSDPPRAKLTDFGCSRKWHRKEEPRMRTVVGTPGYMSPEILRRAFKRDSSYDGRKSDVWACGIMLAQMFFGFLPFWNTKIAMMGEDQKLFARMTAMLQQEWKYSNRHIKKGAEQLSAECQDLLSHLLDPKEESRLTIEELQEHPWVTAPLPHKLENALAVMEEEQVAIETHEKLFATRLVETQMSVDAILDAAAGRADVPPEARSGLYIVDTRALWLGDTSRSGKSGRGTNPDVAGSDVQAHKDTSAV